MLREGRSKIPDQIHCEQARQRRAQAERLRMRKVRASQGGIAANGSRRRLQGKCNREIPPVFPARVERRGKSSPAARRRAGHANPIRSNTAPRAKRRPAGPHQVAGAARRRAAKIDRCHLQNPAYQSGRKNLAPRGASAARGLFRCG